MTKTRQVYINWITDERDCETCGTNYGEGVYVAIDGKTILDQAAIASCYDSTYVDPNEVYALIVKELGGNLKEEYTEVDYDDQD